MIAFCKRIAANALFQDAIIGVIIVNAVFLGLETSPRIMQSAGAWLLALNWIVQAIFVFEIAVRILAHRPRPAAFFRSGWNVFDFVVLRVTRLVSVFPQLRLIINTMLLSIPSRRNSRPTVAKPPLTGRNMGHVVLLLSPNVYGIAGVYLFRDADSQHWGTLGAALLSLFQIVTLEGWVESAGRLRNSTQPSGSERHSTERVRIKR